MFREIFKFLASLKLALLLLAVIIVATMMGTIYESSFNADVARKYIYDAWWFNLWLTMLCVNLFSVAAIRYPWKPHQTGFVITHAGIIILLIGGMIDRRWGEEGFIPLVRSAPPSENLIYHAQLLTVSTPGTATPARTELSIKSMVSPRDFNINVKTPSPDIKVDILDMRPPAVQLVLQGPMMGRNEQWLFLGDNTDMGPAALKFLPGMPPEPKAEEPKAAEKKKMVPRLERHFIFSKQDFPISKAIHGAETGAKLKLVIDEAGDKADLKLSMMGKDFSFNVKETVKKSTPLDGLDGWRIYIVDYFPNFRMMPNGVPGTLNDKPENPALLVELNGPLTEETPAEDADDPHGGGATMPKKGANELALYLGADGKLRFFAKSRVKGEFAGDVVMDKPVSVGWAPGAEFIVQKLIPSGITTLLSENSEEVNGLNSKRLERVRPGLLCKVTVGSESKDVWVPSTGNENEIPRSVNVGGKEVTLSMPNKFTRMPFKIALEKFDAPPQEGMQGSMNFMSFASTLSFVDKEDPKQEKRLDLLTLKPDSKFIEEMGKERAQPGTTNVFRGAIFEIDEANLKFTFEDRHEVEIPRSEVQDFVKQTHRISMNRPTTYPETWYGPWLGTGYKFSQAGHDMPNDPDYSGIQVLRDPGWAPKWIGCIMICFGIFTMFYLKPYFNRVTAPAKTVAAKAPASKKAGGVSNKEAVGLKS